MDLHDCDVEEGEGVNNDEREEENSPWKNFCLKGKVPEASNH